LTTSPGSAPVLLENGYVLALDDADTRGRLSVAIEGASIAGVDSRDRLRRRFPTATRFNCAGRLIMPGLVNAHLHPDLHIVKGELEERDLHDWQGAARFNRVVDFLGTPEGAPLQRLAILASLAEAALSGTTCVATYGVTQNSEAECERALNEVGLRGTITIRDDVFSPAGNGASRLGPGHAGHVPAARRGTTGPRGTFCRGWRP
jgi:cytosine/adenosine deaminase-related metal-dependent hydrolase